MKRQIKFYSINERFDFGKYKGRTVLGVARDNPGYINWCLETVSFFIMDEKTIKELSSEAPRYRISKPASDKVKQKLLNLTRNDHDDYDHDDYNQSISNVAGKPAAAAPGSSPPLFG
jgi:hypothetical protein